MLITPFAGEGSQNQLNECLAVTSAEKEVRRVIRR